MRWNPSSSTERRLRGLLAGAGLVLWAAGAAAEEAAPAAVAPPPPAALIFKMLSAPPESSAAALTESLRPDAATRPARAEARTEVLPDGSVRYQHGPTTVILKNPCPEGDPFHDKPALARSLPGRSRR